MSPIKKTKSVSTSRAEARAKKPAGPCELCGAKADLVHHKDENPMNNDPGNLERLCKPCHKLRHHAAPERLVAMRNVREELARLIRRYDLTNQEFDLVCKHARRNTGLSKAKRSVHRILPKVLPEAAVKSFYEAIDKTENLTHQIMLRLLYYTGVRVGELCAMKISDIYLQEGKIFIEQGKGGKDRYVLIPDRFRLLLRAYIEQPMHTNNVYLFQSRQRRKYSTRRVQQIVSDYSAAAGIPHVHPHLLRHSCLTFLTKAGLKDTQIQLISGHASKTSLEIYQHLALGDVKPDYDAAMQKLEV